MKGAVGLLAVGLSAAALGLVTLRFAAAPPPQSTRSAEGGPLTDVVVNVAERFQTIDGFGASQRVWTDGHVANGSGPPPEIPESVQHQILKELYTDLGLTRLRTHGIGFNTEPVNDNDDPLRFEWSGFHFDCDAGAGCGVDARISYAKQALPLGLSTLVSENNPMPWMDGSNPEEHAENTLALLLHWRRMGLEPRYQTLMNEPSHRGQWLYSLQRKNPLQRALSYASSEIPWADAAWHRAVVKALGPRLRAAGLHTLLVIPDDLNACVAYPIAKAVLEDVEARQYVGALAYHLYGGSASCLRAMKDLSLRHRIPVWMTEHWRRLGYEGALAWAKEIHALVANSNVSAVDYLFGFFGDYVTKHGDEYLIHIAFDGARYVSHRRTPKYYVTGQFSRFVRPGSVRVEATASDDSLLVTAFRGREQLIIVLVNSGSARRARIVVHGLANPLSFVPVRTSPTDNWRELAPVKLDALALGIDLAPQSVTTLVGSAGRMAP